MSPDLSIVWASRNDDYANGVNERLIRSLESAQITGRELGIDLELIVVDWNSPNGNSLSGLLIKAGVHGVRVIEVPSSLSFQYSSHPGKPFVEYLAKNIGIRRARGSQVAVVNADVLISRKLMSLCVERPFLETSFLRADRLDFEWSSNGVKIAKRLNVRHGRSSSNAIVISAKSLSFFQRGSSRLAGESRRKGVIVGEPGGVKKHFLLGMHTNAAGDFICTSMNNWVEANGFSESKWLTTMGDALMVARLASLGLRQLILPGAQALFHEDHPVGTSREGAWSEGNWPSFLSELLSVCSSPNFKNEEEFGKKQIFLSENHL
jgi:hypothetical protein